MEQLQPSWTINLIWGIADDDSATCKCTKSPADPANDGPAVPERTRADMLGMKKNLAEAGVAYQGGAQCQAAGQAFYDASPLGLRDLGQRSSQQLCTDFGTNDD